MKLLLLFIFLNMTGPDLSVYRKLMDYSVTDGKAADRFYEKLKNVKDNDASILIGFRAMSEFMQSKHLINPISRLKHFNRGRKLLEIALQKDKTSPELMLFRLITQSNVPALLNYSDNIPADKSGLIAYLKRTVVHTDGDTDLHKRIRNYLLTNQHCSAEEKSVIKSLPI